MTDYKIDLNGGDHAVLLIHGLTGSPFELKPLAKKLNKAGFSVKGPCLAGHCRTLDELKGTSWQDWYGTVHATFKELKRNYRNVSVSGLCMGSLFALYLAAEVQEEVSSIALLSTTLFYDGWSLPWYKFLLPLSYYPPFKYFYSYAEREPYGIKDERMRKQIALALREGSIAHPEFPAQCIRELFMLIKEVRKILPKVEAPALILHALEDDLASIKNADYVESHIGSSDVRKVYIEDSYHMLTLDHQKNLVAEEVINFFRNHSRK
ncbi:MAG: alpha/beta fold hydrolase [Nitrospiraceae bacterium]|nr:alpha/beta fold hydrolase [Nitrospiraceae bacterium]